MVTVRVTLTAKSQHRSQAWPGRGRESVTPRVPSKLHPHQSRPLVRYRRCKKVSFGTQRLSVVRNSEVFAIREQKMYCVYRNSCWYIHIARYSEEVRYWRVRYRRFHCSMGQKQVPFIGKWIIFLGSYPFRCSIVYVVKRDIGTN